MDRMVINIQLTWIFKTYRICNSMVGFSKYEFYNKFLGGVTLFTVTPDVIYIYICMYIFMTKHTMLTYMQIIKCTKLN